MVDAIRGGSNPQPVPPPTSGDAALFASQLAAAQQAGASPQAAAVPQTATAPVSNAPGVVGGNYEKLITKFSEIYGSREMTLGTILDGAQKQYQDLFTWVRSQGPEFESWMKQSEDVPGKNQVVAFSNYDFINGNFNDKALAGIVSAGGDLATMFDTLKNDLNGLGAIKLDNSNPENFINSVHTLLSTARSDLSTLLSTDSSAPGALQRLQSAMDAALKHGWSEDVVAYEALKGMYGAGRSISFSPGTLVNQMWQAVGSKITSFGDQLAPMVENAAKKLPGVITAYNTNKAMAFLNLAVNLGGAFLSLGTGFTKLGLAGGLSKVIESDAKALSEFGGLLKTGLDILKNTATDWRAISGLRLPSTYIAPGVPTGQTGANLDNAMSHWIQAVAAYWGNDGIGGAQIAGYPNQISGGVSFTPPPAPPGDSNYSVYYWIRSERMVGAPHPIPQTVWTLYGIPRTN